MNLGKALDDMAYDALNRRFHRAVAALNQIRHHYHNGPEQVDQCAAEMYDMAYRASLEAMSFVEGRPLDAPDA